MSQTNSNTLLEDGALSRAPFADCFCVAETLVHACDPRRDGLSRSNTGAQLARGTASRSSTAPPGRGGSGWADGRPSRLGDTGAGGNQSLRDKRSHGPTSAPGVSPGIGSSIANPAMWALSRSVDAAVSVRPGIVDKLCMTVESQVPPASRCLQQGEYRLALATESKPRRRVVRVRDASYGACFDGFARRAVRS